MLRPATNSAKTVCADGASNTQRRARPMENNNRATAVDCTNALLGFVKKASSGGAREVEDAITPVYTSSPSWQEDYPLM